MGSGRDVIASGTSLVRVMWGRWMGKVLRLEKEEGTVEVMRLLRILYVSLDRGGMSHKEEPRIN